MPPLPAGAGADVRGELRGTPFPPQGSPLGIFQPYPSGNGISLRLSRPAPGVHAAGYDCILGSAPDPRNGRRYRRCPSSFAGARPQKAFPWEAPEPAAASGGCRQSKRRESQGAPWRDYASSPGDLPQAKTDEVSARRRDGRGYLPHAPLHKKTGGAEPLPYKGISFFRGSQGRCLLRPLRESRAFLFAQRRISSAPYPPGSGAAPRYLSPGIVYAPPVPGNPWQRKAASSHPRRCLKGPQPLHIQSPPAACTPGAGRFFVREIPFPERKNRFLSVFTTGSRRLQVKTALGRLAEGKVFPLRTPFSL